MDTVNALTDEDIRTVLKPKPVSSQLRQRLTEVIASTKSKVMLVSVKKSVKQEVKNKLDVLYTALTQANGPLSLKTLVDLYGPCHTSHLISSLKRHVLDKSERRHILIKQKEGYMLQVI